MKNISNNLYFYLLLFISTISKADGPSKALELMQAIVDNNYPDYVIPIDQAIIPDLPYQLKMVQQNLLDNNPEKAHHNLRFLLRDPNKIPGFIKCANFYQKVTDYASGGRLTGVKIFDERIEQFFVKLFEAIVTYGNQQEFLLVADDLFHGHVILLHDKVTNFSDIIIVFHAKEFPADLPEAGGFKSRAASPVNFNMKDDTAFNKRNFIYSLRSHALINLQKNPLSPDYKSYKELITEYDPYSDLRVNTVREHYFGQPLFDINYFPNLHGFAKNVPDPQRCPVLFAY
ncbi:MAG: hypothetical protein LVQ75_00175 [Candidatus Babeliales bacterium]|jgi:hypothetical protein